MGYKRAVLVRKRMSKSILVEKSHVVKEAERGWVPHAERE